MNSGSNWFFRYKIYHLPFWFVYHYLNGMLLLGGAGQTWNLLFHTPYVIKFLFYFLFQAVGVYFNLYFLIPRFLEKGRYVEYITFISLTIILITACIVTGYYASAWWSEKTFQELFNRDPGDYMHFFKENALPSTVAAMTLGMSLKLAKNWIQVRQREKLLEKEKLETELKFLKSQFNPHFLFNTINSIFVLIGKNPGMASDALAKFSDLLRYQLYECNEQEILLKQELLYLENFIELQILRQDTRHLEVDVQLERDHDNLVIAPFILIPFLENAFKHVSHRNDSLNWIRVKLSIDNHLLLFTVCNSRETGDTPREFMIHQGIGLKNVQRRLDLIYPGKHELIIEEKDGEFKIDLSLRLHAGKVYERKAVALAEE